MKRLAIDADGLVQGVGFRPFAYQLADRFHLSGFVRNEIGGVVIEVQGEDEAIRRFCDELRNHPPPLARIDNLRTRPLPPRREDSFRIESSRKRGGGIVRIAADIATCDECLEELFDPADRRYRYPFLNCTNCGPRLTIVTGAPYDRAQTTMASFTMCPECHSEYSDPRNRRFHAQPVACPYCGPRLELRSSDGRPIDCRDPLGRFAAALLAGELGGLKGLGGFHLACDARDEAAVARLRQRKHREEKPFAIMVQDMETAARYCRIEPAERDLLESRRRPIVLLKKHSADGEDLAPSLAPGNPYLGVMLPYTPLHHLLLDEVGGIPLVMTSGNRADEPTAYRDDDAFARLGEIADLFLTHNREIHVRCDDSVTRVVRGEELPLRRSRGYAPQTVKLPIACPCPTVALGGQFKGAFALGHQTQAILSHHLGDLDHYEANRALQHDLKLYQQLFEMEPEILVHDLHPDYATTAYAKARAEDTSAPNVALMAVQHHHSHMASCMAENGLDEPVIGVTFDGTGYGTDGTIWGGEFLVGDYREFRRAAHLRYVGLPGGDVAIRQPWRMALAHLLDAGCDPAGHFAEIPSREISVVTKMLKRQINAPQTSSMGRLFDAAAALILSKTHAAYEGQAAMQLEWSAAQATPQAGYGWSLIHPADPANQPLVIDTRPLIRAIVEDLREAVEAPVIARRFHATIANQVVEICRRIREHVGLRKVVLSGGVFSNALLLEESMQVLEAAGFEVYRHRLVPPNDGGLSLGQLAISAARIAPRENIPPVDSQRSSSPLKKEQIPG